MTVARFRLTAARLTPGGRGAIATIRVQVRLAEDLLLKPDETANLFAAVDPLFVAANGQPLSAQQLQKIAFGKWGSVDGEDLVICRLTPDSFEIYCHGGDAAVRRVLQDLADVGCEILSWVDQVSLTAELVHVECLEVLSCTTTWRTTRIALEQSNGLLKSAFAQLQSAHDANDATVEQQIDALLAWAQFGLHLAAPWNVVLTGRPNVGKSSLINQLLGYQRAIVFDQPGTTRDVVTGETAFDGWPVMLADTAGIRNDAGNLEAAGIALARQRLLAADLQIVVIDLSQAPSREDELLLQAWPRAIVVGNKADLPDQWVDRLPRSALRISSVTGEGLAELQRQLVQKLVPQVPAERTAIPVSSRQIERLREARNATSREQRGTAIARLINDVRDERQ